MSGGFKRDGSRDIPVKFHQIESVFDFFSPVKRSAQFLKKCEENLMTPSRPRIELRWLLKKMRRKSDDFLLLLKI
jgi:hypothetical protein